MFHEIIELIFSRCAMTAVRDTLCNLRPLEIPRPHIPGLQFIPTRGRLGFYKSIRRDGAQFGLQIKPMGPRRPALADACWDPPVNASKQSNPETSSRRSNPDASKQLNEQSCGERLRNSMNSSDEESQTSSISQLSNYSDGSASTRNSPVDEPEYPEPDYDIITPPNVKTKLCADTINNLRKF
ncbi:unnamed protein product [Anisakis simplex]|uniref:Uncharacterized protein n=1 Tax=Anisakis simplex TaxID=6269 RepID=A0A0M3JW80_ANISI|nr:unnamed protein product [Anisakis simplex]